MTTRTPADSDPFFQLLGDALRAGPGSAQWGEAVNTLRDGGVEGADEYRLILRAREDLEQGRDFRRVTAGPGFTRKVLEAVEQEGGRKRHGLPTATIIALLAGAVIVGVIIAVVLMSRGGNTGRAAVERLEAASLPVSVASGSWPGQLNGFELAQDVPTTSPAQLAPATRLTTTRPLDPSIPATIEAEIVVPRGKGPHLASLFVTDTGERPQGEISVFYNDGRASVDIGGRGGAGDAVDLGPLDTFKLSIRFDRETAIIEAGGRRLYAGPHGIGDGPRHAGMRVIQPTGAKGEPLRVKSITVAQAVSPAGGR